MTKKNPDELHTQKPLSLLSLPLNTIQYTVRHQQLPLMGRQIYFTPALCVSVPPFFLEKETLTQWGLRDTDQSWLHNYPKTILDKWTLTCLSHNMLFVCLFQLHSLHTHSICARTHTTHTPPILFVLRNLLACQHWKTWKRSSARVHHALNVRLATRTLGEQSRYYFKTIPVNSGMHYLIYYHVNDSVHASYGSNVVSVSMVSVYDINRVRRLGSNTQRTVFLSYDPRCELSSFVANAVGSKGP